MKILFLTVVLLWLWSSYYYFFNHNWMFIINELYIFFWFFKTFIHEFWHWIWWILTWWYIDTIDMSLTYSEASKWSLWVCYCATWNSIFSKVFMTYMWHFNVFLSLVIFSYFFWIKKSEYIFLIFSLMTLVYTIKWHQFSDVLFWWILTLFCLWVFFWKFFEKIKNIKEILWVILLWFLFSWTIQEILNLSFWSEHWKITSDSYKIFEYILIPQFVTVTSWILFALLSLSISYSFVFWDLNVWFLDRFNHRIHKILWYDRKKYFD